MRPCLSHVLALCLSHVVSLYRAEANYGGRVTDELDRRVLNSYLNKFYCEEALTTPNYPLSPLPTYYIPDNGTLQSFKVGRTGCEIDCMCGWVGGWGGGMCGCECKCKVALFTGSWGGDRGLDRG